MMDAVSDVMQARQVALATQIQTEVAKKSLEAASLQGQAVAEMLQAAVGASKAEGCGTCFDAVG